MEDSTNLIKAMSEVFKGVDHEFLRRVCQQFGWSEATFYRRRRRSQQLLSITEKQAIHTLGEKIIEDTLWKIENLKSGR